jgi:hypothetical protein
VVKQVLLLRIKEGNGNSNGLNAKCAKEERDVRYV